jgi:hypothetical protein
LNLASLLALTASPPTTAMPLQAAAGAESPILPEFATLLGLAAAPAHSAAALPADDEMPATTGKILPDAAMDLPQAAADLPLEDTSLLQLPELPPALAAMVTVIPVEAPAARQLPGTQDEPPRTAAVPMPPATVSSTFPATLPARQQVPSATTTSKDTGETPARPASLQQAAAAPAVRQPLKVQLDVRPPLPVTALPVPPAAAEVADESPPPAAVQQAAQQLVQGTDQRRLDALRIPVTAAAALLPDAERPAASPGPVTPVAPPAVVASALTDAPRPVAAADPQSLQPSAIASPAGRHDFEAIVDRLAEARELARPGRASLQLAHREFGPVSVQFDMAGQSLKVALASADAAFAPAVQAALAERPVMAPGDASAMRSDARSDQPAAAPAGAATSGPAAQGEGQRQDHNSRGAQSRSTAEQVQRQPHEAGDSDAPPSRRSRDGSLFA